MLFKIIVSLSTIAVLTLSTVSFAEQQILQLTPVVQQSKGSQVQLQVSYDTSDANSVTGIGLRVHYNAQQLSFNKVSGVLLDGLQAIGKPQPDQADYDNDPDTDTYLVLAWMDLNGHWPSSTLPTSLFQITFNATSQHSERSAVRISATSTASGYTLQANPVWIEP